MKDTPRINDFSSGPPAEDRLRVDVSTQAQPEVKGSLWVKMLVGAIVMPVPVGIVAIRVMVETFGEEAEFNPLIAGVILVASALVGAMLGGLLHLKDVVNHRMALGEPVSAIPRWLFGNGLKSLLLVWIPIIFFIVLVVLPIILVVRPF